MSSLSSDQQSLDPCKAVATVIFPEDGLAGSRAAVQGREWSMFYSRLLLGVAVMLWLLAVASGRLDGQVTGTWTGNNSANWNSGANWIGGAAPNGIGATALFGPATAANVFISNNSSNNTLGALTFNSAQAYTIYSAGNHNLIFQASSGSALLSLSNTGSLSLGNATTGQPILVNSNWSVVNNSSNPTGLLIGSASTVALGANTVTFSGSGNTNIGAVVSGTGGVVLSSGNLAMTGANTYTGSTTINGGTLQINSGSSLGATSGNLVLGNGTLEAVASLSVARNYNLTSANSAILVDAGQTMTENGLVSGSGTLNYNGGAGSTLILNGANTYSGGTFVNGALSINSTTALGTGSATLLDGSSLTVTNAPESLATNLIIATGATAGLAFTNASSTSFSGTVTGSSTSILNLTSAAGPLTLSGTAEQFGNFNGTLNLASTGSNNFRLNGATDFSNATINLESTGGQGLYTRNASTISIGALTGVAGSVLNSPSAGSGTTVWEIGALNTADTFAGNLTQSNGSISALTKVGTGILTLTGANLYSGNTTYNAGEINFSNLNNIGNGTQNFNGGALQWAAGTGTDVSALPTFFDVGGANFDTNGNDVTLGSAIGGGGTGGLTKSGGGTLTLSGTSSYSGGTTITGGTLSTSVLANGGVASGIGSSNASAANLVINGGTLQYTGGTVSTNRAFTLGTAGGALDASGTGAVTFSNTTAVAFSGTGTRTLIFTGNNTGANTLAAVLTDQGGNATSVTKNGVGEWVLTGNNTFSGTATVNGGTLKLNASTGSALNNASLVVVNSGGTLMLGASNQINGGALGSVAANLKLNGGTFATAGFSQASNTLGTLTLSATSTIDLGAGTSSIHFDVSNGQTWNPGSDLLVLNWNGTIGGSGGGTDQLIFGTTSGSLTTSQVGQIIFVNPNGVAGTYDAEILGTGEVIASSTPFKPIPEPGTYAAGGVLAGLLGWWEWRRRRARVVKP